MEIKQLVEQFQNGDENAFSFLIEPIKEKLYRIIYTYTRNEESALDVLSEVIYKAYRNLIKLKNRESFETWIIKIAINESKTYIKNNKKVVYIEDYKIDEEVKQQNTEEKMDIKEGMEELSEEIRNVIILKYYFDMTFEQIAKVLEKPSSTIKTWHYKALNKLKEKLQEGGDVYGR